MLLNVSRATDSVRAHLKYPQAVAYTDQQSFKNLGRDKIQMFIDVDSGWMLLTSNEYNKKHFHSTLFGCSLCNRWP